jgi:hypothetical protein
MSKTSLEHRLNEDTASWKYASNELDKYVFIINAGIIYVVLHLLQLHSSGELVLSDDVKIFISSIGFASLSIIAVFLYSFRLAVEVTRDSIISIDWALELEEIKASETDLEKIQRCKDKAEHFETLSDKTSSKLKSINNLIYKATIAVLILTAIAVLLIE